MEKTWKKLRKKWKKTAQSSTLHHQIQREHALWICVSSNSSNIQPGSWLPWSISPWSPPYPAAWHQLGSIFRIWERIQNPEIYIAIHRNKSQSQWKPGVIVDLHRICPAFHSESKSARFTYNTESMGKSFPRWRYSSTKRPPVPSTPLPGHHLWPPTPDKPIAAHVQWHILRKWLVVELKATRKWETSSAPSRTAFNSI